MIRIQDLTVKNFMSVGNTTQAVDFNKQQLTLVLGENLDQGGDDSGSRNGTGKTTIINALSYALYGQALTNIRRDNLVNKTNNKGMLVTLAFTKNGKDYRIERGRKPNTLKFYIDQKEQELTDESQGDSRKTQGDINDLLGMSHDMFKHIVALNTYTEPFLALKPNDQRAIIEQLLGITILSEKADLLREATKITRDKLTEENARIQAITNSNDKIKENIERLHSRKKAWIAQNKQDRDKLEKAIRELEQLDIDSELEDHEKLKTWEENSKHLTNLRKERATVERALEQADNNVNKLGKQLDELETAKCYACGQDLHDDKLEEMKDKLQKDYGDAHVYQTSMAEKMQKVEKLIEDIGELDSKPNTFYETAKEAYQHRSNVDSLKQSLKEKTDELDPYTEQIDDLEKTAIQEVNWDVVNELNDTKDHQDFLYKLLTNKDSFIRKKIIDQNLAYLNNRLTHYLDRLQLPHTVVFKNDLTVEITQLGQDLDFDNLSRGERNRLILGLSWAFRDVWESLYQNINLLFIDELVDSGMDANGVENAIAVLKKMGRERQKNIYLISHKEELASRVTNVLKVIKENGFTSYDNDVEVMT
jgi:DNA repair exonuclease SbcCD ATPase subunit|tara:strand:+ start:12424 stop:14196 length:1773 start_codon:yes stop_codon:yes gene_type:complete